MSDYQADGTPIGARDFIRLACDPLRSAVVEACAGSGKTWLLVSRVIRLLLAGAAPGEILAITFTRRAAQEMHSRLLRELRHLAEMNDVDLRSALEARGLSGPEADRALGSARQLYERVVTARVPLTIETFHGWFWRLVSRAPLGAGVPFSPALLEAAERVRADAWLHFLAALLQPRHADAREGWEWLLDDVGEVTAKTLLMDFLHKRAEWWSFAAADFRPAADRVLDSFGPDTEDPGGRVRAPAFVDAVRTLAELWRVASSRTTVNSAIERAERWHATQEAVVGADLLTACHVVLTRTALSPIVALTPAQLAVPLAAAGQLERYRTVHAFVTAELDRLLSQRRTWRARRLNAAGLTCGTLLVDTYQTLKAREHAIDFTDLEWHALRLLADPEHAAYMQARLDARYRHILLDEFQDTNALQWQVLQSWLAAYGPSEGGAVTDRPSVFVVGDPKQSIYRFRRAEPRVFGAAIELLQRDFAAHHLRTNVTRRNAPAIIDALNATMSGNPLFQPQTTQAATAAGAFVLLPLAQPTPASGGDTGALRDVLTTPRPENVSDARYREGLAIANEIRSWHRRLTVGDSPRAARWSDVLLLVRRRTHLQDYERALRDAGVPFVSDRRGGLLATLEAADFDALLQFLTTPDADLRLAHALRSPLLGCSDEDLIRLASASGGHWWARLQRLQDLSPALSRARALLHRWLGLAGVLPVHDLLDRIYFEGDARRRYAAAAPAAALAQVQANLDAFIELALQLDAGRFPSLSRFIDELTVLRRQGGDEAPDEGMASAEDAVRVLTIHGAKGLEAEVVVLADAHATPPNDGARVLVSWPPESAAPDHLSLLAGGENARDAARAVWLAADDAQREQEDWNLLYVAATRARQVLVVSGSRSEREPAASWYTRMHAAAAFSADAAPAEADEPITDGRRVRDFLPEPIPTGRRAAPVVDTDSMRLGRAWHALLEHGEDAPAEAIARAHGITRQHASEAQAAAAHVRATLPQLFVAGSTAETELVAVDGQLLRVDRLVEIDGTLWVIDFKWRMTEQERPQYEAQVRRYAELLRSVHGQTVRMGIVTAAAMFAEIDAQDTADST